MTLSKMIKIGAVALAVSTTALVAMPAQAAPPHFNFSFGFGNFGNYPDHGMWRHRDHDFGWDRDRIEEKLSEDYRDVSFVRMVHDDYLFVGRQGHTWFQLVVDPSDGHVWAKPIHRSSNGDFSFSLTF